MTPQELKNSILQLAIQGKLVEQRPEEGTAEELYRKIQEEKQRLIKEGRIKKEKSLPEITEEEKPFEIPENWMWIRVGNCGSWSAGATPPRTNAEYYNGNIPWLKTGDLNDGVIEEIPECISDLALEKTSVRINPVGSVLMAMYGATIGKLGILAVEATTNQACCACIPYSGIYNKYLFFYLMVLRPSFIKMGEGGAQPNISKEKIVSTAFSLPPIAEQKRIVAKIEELLPYIDRYEQAWSCLEAFNQRFPDDMRKSILQLAIQGKLTEQYATDEPASKLLSRVRSVRQQMHEKKIAKKSQATELIDENEITFELPENWTWAKLGWICKKVGAGSTPKGGSAVYVSSGIKFLREQNVHDDGLHIDNVVFIDEITNEQMSGSVVQPMDILMNITGGSIGRNALVPDDFDKANVNQHVLIIRLIDKELRHYVHYCLCSPFILQQMYSMQSGDKPGLSATKVENFIIPLPPLAEQKRIVARLEELLPICAKLK